jgi:endonuclease/exonuclease/phosphatase family metal-dependent hydrolase
VHLSLFGRSRRRQLDALATRLEALVPADAPLIIAGDFNDWRNRAHDQLAERLGMIEVFGGAGGRPPKSFPSSVPVLRLDRIYVRGFGIESAHVHFGAPWSQISDHAALSAILSPTA